MRLSTAEISQTSISAILDQQSQLNHTQQQLSTGRRIVTPADDPAGAAQALNLQAAIDTNTQLQKNGDAATARLNLEQSTLTQVQNVVQRVRTLTIEANNGTQTNESRSSIASELSQSLKSLLSLGNTRDSNGEYIFAGSQTTTQPFTQTPTNTFVYAGDSAQRFLQIDSSRQVATNDPGSSVFMQITNGNGTFIATPAAANTGSGIIDPGSVTNSSAYTGDTYSIQFTAANTYDVMDTTTGTTVLSNQTYQSDSSISFAGIQTSISGTPATGDTFTVAPSGRQSVFQTVQNIVDTLNTPTSSVASNTKLHNSINQQLSALDQALGNIINKQAGVGSRLTAISSQQSLQQDWGTQLKSAQSKIQDVDYASAISQYQLQLTGLEAAQKTYTQVQGLSLFKYL
ncbi:MAG: flagellar hook-associated protein FlgL [Acidihalobacter sp.]|jgi:flagellar hook-associated protein 3 FlgL|uniref:flagellar hook-associated protein FlgL n=1 Tax=Acidihalobacter sp. TaxID=1872108 RepID=UPI00307E30DE